MRKSLFLLIIYSICVLLSNISFGQTTVSYDFSDPGAVTGLNEASPGITLDANIGFASFKNSGTSNPAIYSGQLRLYQNTTNTNTKGGSIKIYANNGVTITQVVVHASGTTGPAAYSVDGGASSSVSHSSGTYTMSSLSGTDNVEFWCTGSSTETRIYVDDFVVTYTGGSSNDPDWCNLQWPANGTITEGGSFDVYAQIYEAGVTDPTGQGSGIQAWIGYSTTNSDPSTWTDWVPATYNTDVGNNDEYMADIGTEISSAGTYYYASKFTVNGTDYSYGGYNSEGGGFWGGSNVSGVLTININYPDWCNLQWPASGNITEGGSFDVYAQIYEPGVTNAVGQGSGIQAWIGYSTSNSDPSTWTNWVAATYNSDNVNNDEYMADIGSAISSAGTYYYASRFTVNGTDYTYGGYNSEGGGFWGGSNVSGELIININYPDWCNLQYPELGTIYTNGTFDVYARVEEAGITNGEGQGGDIQAWIGYSSSDTNPATWTDWVSANYNTDYGDSDEYVADIGSEIGTAGTYYYASRFTVNGTDYSYGGYNSGGGGFWNGTNVSGILTVNSCPTLSAPVATNAVNIDETEFTATWNAVAGADGYYLDIYAIGSETATDLIISEYVEGSGNNKYIEIFNGTGLSVDLSNYRLRLYSNGASSPSKDIKLSGTLNNNETIVYKNSSASKYEGTATTNAAVNFSGNDAVVLYKISTSSNVDIFGCIGEDPGPAWTNGSHSTSEKTLVRKATVTSGITTNPTTGFPTLVSEWDVYSQDDVSHLGSHTIGGASTQNYVIQNQDVGDVTSYYIEGLTSETTYFYVVRAYNNCGSTSDDSNEIEVFTIAPSDASDGQGVAEVSNGGINSLNGYDIWQRNKSDEIIIIEITGIVTDHLTNASVELPNEYTGLSSSNVSISGDAVVSGTAYGVSGNTITIIGLELSSIKPLTIEVSGISTPSNSNISDNGIHSLTVKTAVQGGTLTSIAESPVMYSTIPISNVKNYNSSNWTLNKIGQTVAVEGITTVASGRLSSGNYDQFFIQEGEGEDGHGLAIRSDEIFNPIIDLSGYYIIKGQIKLVRGSSDEQTDIRANMTALSEPEEIIFLNDTILPEPFLTTIEDLYAMTEAEFEEVDGVLMRLHDASKSSGTWPSSNSSFANIYIKDENGTNDLRCYIFANTDIGGNPEPEWPTSMVTLVYNYDENGDDNYDGVTERQITPIYYDNFYKEIVWDGSTGNTLWSDPQNWSPNLLPQEVDDVKFDNITGPASDYLVTLDARHQAFVKSVTIIPDIDKEITLIIPESNSNAPALELNAEGNGITIHDGGIFINNSGAPSGNPVMWHSSGGSYPDFTILNGGKYVHNTLRSTANMTERLSATSGTENGTFEIDLNSASANFQISASGKTFGNLVLSGTYGNKNYSITGPSPVEIKGDLIVNSGVSINEVSSGMSFTNEFIIYGNLIFNGDNWTINSNNELNNIQFVGNETQSINIQPTALTTGFPKEIVVDNGTELSLDSDLYISKTIELKNGNLNLNTNTLNISGNLIYTSGTITGDATASIVFEGSGNESLDFTPGAAQLGTLSLNRSGATITLLQDLTIASELIMQNGYINNNTYTLVLGQSATLSGGSYNSFVDGKVSKSGNSVFTFPTGDIRQRDLNDDEVNEEYYVYGPIMLTPLSSNTISAEYNFTEPPYDWWQHGGNMSPSLIYVSSREYWNVSTTENLGQVSLGWDNNSHAEGELCIHDICPNNQPNNFSFADLSVAVYHNAMWNDLGQSANSGNHDQGYITSNLAFPIIDSKQTDYVVTLGSKNPDVTLPIELISFTGKYINNEILLEWSTLSEINNDYFSIEHSTNGYNFSEIGIVLGNGNSSIQNDYSFIHNNYKNTHNYYRLKQIDYDGSFTYSEIIAVNANDEKNNKLHIQLSYDDYLYVWGINNDLNNSYYISDILGRKLLTGTLNSYNDTNYHIINISQLTAGTYIIVFYNSTQKESYKFIIQ